MSVLVGSNLLVTHVGHMMSVIESSRFKQYEVDYFETLPASYKGGTLSCFIFTITSMQTAPGHTWN